jgi:hypothetical protein
MPAPLEQSEAAGRLRVFSLSPLVGEGRGGWGLDQETGSVQILKAGPPAALALPHKGEGDPKAFLTGDVLLLCAGFFDPARVPR